jgi:hypothetical protein
MGTGVTCVVTRKKIGEFVLHIVCPDIIVSNAPVMTKACMYRG